MPAVRSRTNALNASRICRPTSSISSCRFAKWYEIRPVLLSAARSAITLKLACAPLSAITSIAAATI